MKIFIHKPMNLIIQTKAHFLVILFLLLSVIAKAQRKKMPQSSVSGIVVYSTHIFSSDESGFSLDTLKFNRKKSLFRWKLSEKSNESEIKKATKKMKAKISFWYCSHGKNRRIRVQQKSLWKYKSI